MSFSPGDLVFAKMKGYRPWPARINALPEGIRVPKGKYPIFFFGTHQICTMAPKDMFPFEANKEKYGKPGQQWFNDSMTEAETNPHLYELGYDPDAEEFLSQSYSFQGNKSLSKTETSIQDTTLDTTVVSTTVIEPTKRASLPSRPKKSKAKIDGSTVKRRNTIAGETQRKPKGTSKVKSTPKAKAALKKTPSMYDDEKSMSSLSSASGSDDEPLSSLKQAPQAKSVKIADEILLEIQKRQLKEEKQALKRLDAEDKKSSPEKKNTQTAETTDSIKSSDEALASSTQEEVSKLEPTLEHKHTKRRSAHQKISYREGGTEDNDDEEEKIETETSYSTKKEESERKQKRKRSTQRKISEVELDQKIETEVPDHKHTKRRSAQRKINYQESEPEDSTTVVKKSIEPSSLGQNVNIENSESAVLLTNSAPSTKPKKRKRLPEDRESSVSSLKSSSNEEDVIQKKRRKEKPAKVKKERKSSPLPKRSKVQQEPEEEKSTPQFQASPPKKVASRLQFKVDIDEDNTAPTAALPPPKISTHSVPASACQQADVSQSLERSLVRYNQLIKVCLVRGKENYPRCIGTINRLKELSPSVKWLHLARCWNLMDTLRKCTKYSLCDDVKNKAQDLYRHFLEKHNAASPQERQCANRMIQTYNASQKASQRNMDDQMQENGAPLANTSDGLVGLKELLSPPLEKSVISNLRPSSETKPIDSNSSILSQKNSSIIIPPEDVPPPKLSTTISLDDKNESTVSKEESVKVESSTVIEEEDPDAIYSSLLTQLPGFELLKEDLGIKENSVVSNKSPNIPQKSLYQPLPGRITEPVAVEWSDEALQAGAAAARQRQRMHMRQRSGRMRVQRRTGSSSSHSSSSTSSDSDSSSSSSNSGRSRSSSNQSTSENRKPPTTSFLEKSHSQDKSDLEKQLPHVSIESSPSSGGVEHISPSAPYTASMLPVQVPAPSGSGPIMDLETRIQHMRSQSVAQAALLSNLDKSPGKWKQ